MKIFKRLIGVIIFIPSVYIMALIYFPLFIFFGQKGERYAFYTLHPAGKLMFEDY